MTALDAALDYATRLGLPVVPAARRKPMIANWQQLATTDPEQIHQWWTEWPHALVGMPTGQRSGICVLDIDMKHGKNGLRSLAKLLDCPILPAAPTVLTPSAGYHLHFERPADGFRNTAGAGGRGIGDGLDWRGDGGLVILPAPGSGYRWGNLSYANCGLRLPPKELLPRQVVEEPNPFRRLLAYPRTGSLAGILRRLHATPQGERNALLFWAACRFAEAVAAKLIGEDDARRLLHSAASDIGLPDREITKTINSAFSRAGG